MKAEDIGPMSALSLYPEALALTQGRKIAPRMAIIHITNRCNHKCTGCEYANVHGKNPDQLKSIRLMRLIDEIANLGTAAILFSGGGEPTLHQNFCQAIAKAKERNMLVGIFSNGIPITNSIAAAININATFIRVSVDAATPATYVAIRKGKESGFTKFQQVIERLQDAKARLNSRLDIGLKFLIRSNNIGEIYTFASLAKELGINNVQYKLLRNEPEEPNQQEIVEAQRQLDHAKGDFPEIKIQGKLGSSEIKVPMQCWISPLRLVISAEGDVHLCNYFNHRRATHTYGNIYKTPLEKIWFSQKHCQAAASINPEACCHYDCRFHSLNRELKDLVENQRQKLDFI